MDLNIVCNKTKVANELCRRKYKEHSSYVSFARHRSRTDDKKTFRGLGICMTKFLTSRSSQKMRAESWKSSCRQQKRSTLTVYMWYEQYLFSLYLNPIESKANK